MNESERRGHGSHGILINEVTSLQESHFGGSKARNVYVRDLIPGYGRCFSLDFRSAMRRNMISWEAKF